MENYKTLLKVIKEVKTIEKYIRFMDLKIQSYGDINSPQIASV